MGRFEKIDYRAVLVATAVLAVREAPLVHRPHYPAANGRAWDSMTVDSSGWRAVAIAAGAVQQHDE